MEKDIKGTRLVLTQGDITEQHVDAIVNAANGTLLGGGGVDGAIHRKGGPSILEQCKEIRHGLPNGLPAGDAVITTAGDLPCRFVIHTVGPKWHGTGAHGETAALELCYRRSLALAAKHEARHVAFPSISTGAYGFPIDRASFVALNGVVRWVMEKPGKLDEVRFVLFSADDLAVYQATFAEVMRTMIGE